MDSTEQPVTPESHAEAWCVKTYGPEWGSNPNCVMANIGFLAGYQANAIRNAGIAQARDLAEAALKRHGFEPGVGKDVVTWVRKRGDWMVETAARVIAERDGLLKEVERLTAERSEAWRGVDEATNQVEILCGEKRALRDELSAAREEARQAHERVAIALRNQHIDRSEHAENMEGLRKQLSAANEAREKAEKERDVLLRQSKEGVCALYASVDEDDTVHGTVHCGNGQPFDVVQRGVSKIADWINSQIEGAMRCPMSSSESGSTQRNDARLATQERDSLKAALEKERAEVEMWKMRGDNHWETLRSIREIARTTGDLERIILWVNDSGSGHTQSAEATLVQVSDRANAAEKERDDLRRQLAEAETEHQNAYTEWLNMRFQLAEWQAVAGKKDAAIREALAEYCGKMHVSATRNQLQAALSTPPATALLDELERAFREAYDAGYYESAHNNAGKPERAWLASETRQRFTTASQSAQHPAGVALTAAEDASGGGSAGGAHGAPKVGEVHP